MTHKRLTSRRTLPRVDSCAAAISLEKNGREIVYAPNAETEVAARRRAFINVEIFAKVLEYYKGNNLRRSLKKIRTDLRAFSERYLTA
jgi:hypothetical protein